MKFTSILKSTIIFAVAILSLATKSAGQYNFKTEKKISCTEVKSQDRTGTCWSFATASFLESELIRMGQDNINLSEMFIVRNIYKDKAMNYILRQGKANFSQGSLSHDLIRMTEKAGLITEEAYSGLQGSETKHDHSEMEAGLKGFLDGVRKSKRLSNHLHIIHFMKNLYWRFLITILMDHSIMYHLTRWEVLSILLYWLDIL